MLHIIIDSMPRRAEGTLFAIRIVIDDVDTGNACFLINGKMVVGDSSTIFIGEDAAIPCCIGSLPNTFYDITGIAHGIIFAIKLSALSAHHIEEDTILIVFGIQGCRIGGPILST